MYYDVLIKRVATDFIGYYNGYRYLGKHRGCKENCLCWDENWVYYYCLVRSILLM